MSAWVCTFTGPCGEEVRCHGGGTAKHDEESDWAVPPSFMCPIGHTIMEEPVMLCTQNGGTYEKSALVKWLERNPHTDPITNQEHARRLKFVPNQALQASISHWRHDLRHKQRLVTKADELRDMLDSAVDSRPVPPPPKGHAAAKRSHSPPKKGSGDKRAPGDKRSTSPPKRSGARRSSPPAPRSRDPHAVEKRSPSPPSSRPWWSHFSWPHPNKDDVADKRSPSSPSGAAAHRLVKATVPAKSHAKRPPAPQTQDQSPKDEEHDEPSRHRVVSFAPDLNVTWTWRERQSDGL